MIVLRRSYFFVAKLVCSGTVCLKSAAHRKKAGPKYWYNVFLVDCNRNETNLETIWLRSRKSYSCQTTLPPLTVVGIPTEVSTRTVPSMWFRSGWNGSYTKITQIIGSIWPRYARLLTDRNPQSKPNRCRNRIRSGVPSGVVPWNNHQQIYFIYL